MEEINDIVNKMISQHRILQKDINDALDLSKNENVDILKISVDLKQFFVDLQEHLHLENEIFYPELLKKMESKGLDTSKTKDFINQMKNIGIVVITFLDKYRDVSSIENHMNDFKKEISDIVGVLNLRIQSEETGVYGYWDMY